MGYSDFFGRATGAEPYDWQAVAAADGLPALIVVETGGGKTAGVVLAWWWRKLHHPDPQVRSQTPNRLVFALPMRALVGQTADSVRGWQERLGDDVLVDELLGGSPSQRSWRTAPERPTVLVATVDMVLSAALNRGYGVSRWTWPMDFGLLNSDTQWVFDEIQLLGPALATSRQLDAFRSAFGAAAPCATTWMSATVRPERLRTVDNNGEPQPLSASSADRRGGLAPRLAARRTITELHTDSKRHPSDLAAAALHRHEPGTRTIVVCNTVQTAQAVHAALRKRLPRTGAPEVVLLHSRFRPPDRNALARRALRPDGDLEPAGLILVATQVIEAGVDVSCRAMITELAPWSSIVQRSGRCNRAGEHLSGASLTWAWPQKPLPYEHGDLDAAASQLRTWEGSACTPEDLTGAVHDVAEHAPVVAVLRCKDLLDLFDTAPDLVGNDVDVRRFIRETDDVDVQVAWRAVLPAEEGADSASPVGRDELCAVPLHRGREWLLRSGGVVATPGPGRGSTAWRPLSADRLRPGVVIIVPAGAGGYDPERGFEPSSRGPVTELTTTVTTFAPAGEDVDGDPASFIGAVVPLATHLADAGAAALGLFQRAPTPGLRDEHRAAAVRAAALHDLGKAHDVFQDTMRRASAAVPGVEAMGHLAKSAGGGARHRRRYFRHELVSALLLREHGDLLMADLDEDARRLATYLAGAHHGRVRLAIRSMPDEVAPADRQGARVALGVADGDVVPAVPIDGAVVPPTTLSLDAAALGHGWTEDALSLLHDPNLGPFRLATLEAFVRVADWLVSAARTEAR